MLLIEQDDRAFSSSSNGNIKPKTYKRKPKKGGELLVRKKTKTEQKQPLALSKTNANFLTDNGYRIVEN